MIPEKASLTVDRNIDTLKTSGRLTTYCGCYLYIIIVFNLITSHIQTVNSFQGTKNALQNFEEVELQEYLPNRHDGCTMFQRAHDLGNTDFEQKSHDHHACNGLSCVIDVDSEHSDGSRSGDAFAAYTRYGEETEPKSLRYDEASQPSSMFIQNISKGRTEDQESQRDFASVGNQSITHLSCPTSLTRPCEISDQENNGKPLDAWKTAYWISFVRALETYINGNGKEREHATMSILRYTMRMSFDSSQIDALCHIYDQLLKGGELTLFDKAHLSFSLHSYGRFFSQGIRDEDLKKIYQLAQLLEQHCRSDPESLVAIWNGSCSEEDQVVRANFDDVVKGSSLRSSWIHGLITSDGIHTTASALREADPTYIEKKLTQIRVILEEYTDWHMVAPPTTWDMLYLMKILYIFQNHVEEKMKHYKEQMAEGLSDQVRNRWDPIFSLLMECKNLISKAELPMPPKNLEMKKAYSEILNSQVQEEGLNQYGWGEGSQNVFLRMAGHQQLIPEKGTTQGLSILMQFMSSITKPKALIHVIQELGNDPSVITDITKHGDHLNHNKILRLIQWLSMKYYADDKVDFLIKKQIIKKAMEIHREIGNSESRDLVFALIGRLLSLHPTDKELLKLAKFDHVWNSLQIQNLSTDFAPPKVKMSPMEVARRIYKFCYEY
ncbi:uncharacterized protein MELLADRAFT_103811 [Melampsora larici-populina 98AG31]|uniref:Uncharacterized protein n=1 Tax=Melampsora larici-populina (strain 98AG31 / pathotype 3-4-7) TaxID=747676 RepID=F4RCJ1_MELLP|nr:uncharacterized protein MELLADRAFT_103811 [Melampsora larici-populina 98AG31]EGG09954.1 hypothetical protein MELLADRAFT_103811 [Melampsora larici-populina 98AG31]